MALETWARERARWEELPGRRARIDFGSHAWRVEPQVELGEDRDVAVRCRPDFVLWPEPAGDDVKPVAVFADGATYHVRPEHNAGRLGDDMRKRSAILASGRFRVWSFAWHDLDEVALGPWIARDRTRGDARDLARRVGGEALEQTLRVALEKGSVEALFEYLEGPSDARWGQAASLIGVALLHRPVLESSAAAIEPFVTAFRDNEHVLPIVAASPPGGSHRLAAQSWAEVGHLLLDADVSEAARAHERPEGLRWLLRLDDAAPRRRQKSFVAGWRQFLRAHNVLQFVPALEVVTTEQITEPPERAEDLDVAPRRRRPSTQPASAGSRLAEVVIEELHEADEALWPVLEEVARAGAAVPVITYEFGEANEGEIEVGWPAARVGVFVADDEAQARSAGALSADGWTVWSSAEVTAEALARALGLKGA